MEALVVSEYVDERQIKSRMSRPSEQTYYEAHLLAVRNIADQFFAFPTPDYPHFRTFVNEPEVEQKSSRTTATSWRPTSSCCSGRRSCPSWSPRS